MVGVIKKKCCHAKLVGLLSIVGLTSACNKNDKSLAPELSNKKVLRVPDAVAVRVELPSMREAQSVIRRFHEALRSRDGSSAVKLVTDNTIVFFEKIRIGILKGQIEKIANAPFFIRYYSMLLLNLMPRELIEMSHEKRFFSLIVDRGYLDSEEIEPVRVLEGLRREASVITVRVAISGETNPSFLVRLYSVRGRLRFDFVSLLKVLESGQFSAYQQFSREACKPINQLLVEEIEKRTKKKFGSKVREALICSGTPEGCKRQP